MRGAVALLLALASCSSWASGVYRCEDVKGRVRYIDRPCEATEGELRPRLVLNSWAWARPGRKEDKVSKDAPGRSEDGGSSYNPVPFTGYRGNPVPFSSPDSNKVREPRYSVVGGR